MPCVLNSPENLNPFAPMREDGPIIISITGAIGSGKSTILDKLLLRAVSWTDCRIHSLKEPVEAWSDDNGTNWLDLFYSDPTRWAYTFQTKILVDQCDIMGQFQRSRDGKRDIIVTERSPYDGLEVFCRNLLDRETITQHEFSLFSKLYDLAAWKCHAIAWIHTPSDVCRQRILSRGRDCESKIDARYYDEISRRYEYLATHHRAHGPTLTLDNSLHGDGFVDANVDNLENWIRDLL